MEVFQVGNKEIFVKEIELANEIIYKDTPVLKYSIKYPRFTSTVFQRFIGWLNRYYRNQAYSLAEHCEGELYTKAAQFYNDSVANDLPFREYEFTSVYYVPYNKNYVLSLYFDQYQYTGGANGTTYETAKSWDVKTGREIGLNELFPAKKHLKDYIVKKVNEEIAIQIKQDPNANANYFDDYEKLTAKYFDPKNFYMTRFAVNIFFQEVTIAPHSRGIPVFGIVYEENQIIRPEPDVIDPYKVRSELLMDATDEVGASSPKDAADIWARGLEHRSGAMQYIVMTKKLKKSYAEILEKNNPNWVTGVSSPWVDSYDIVKQEDLKDGSVLIDVKINTVASTGFWDSYYAKLAIAKEDGFWRINQIQADKELAAYMGNYSG